MDLAERVVELCGWLSVTGEEAALAAHLEERYAAEDVQRVGDSLVVGAPDGRPLVLLVGHVDVVPPTDEDREPRIEDREGGPVVVGRGSSDMKGGVAVAEAVFGDRELRSSSPYAVALVLYAREEGSVHDNELAVVLAEVPWLSEAELAVVLEPTDLEVQAGCNGGLHAHLVFDGTAAHSSRPWLGDNAITRALPVLVELDAREPVDVEVDGLTYRDVLVVTQASTSNARNVIPDRFVVNVNYRFAPTRSLGDAEDELRDWVDGRAAVEIVDRAPPAPPRLDAPLVARFTEAVDAPVTAKQAWTDVARFAEVDVPALNFGPGLTGQAHRSGEHVPVDNLRAAEERLRRFLASPSGR